MQLGNQIGDDDVNHTADQCVKNIEERAGIGLTACNLGYQQGQCAQERHYQSGILIGSPGYHQNRQQVKQREGDFNACQVVKYAEQANCANSHRSPENGVTTFENLKDPLYF